MGGLGSLRAPGAGPASYSVGSGPLSVLLIDRNAELSPGHRYRVAAPARCLAGLCPGPALVDLVLSPARAVAFGVPMVLGLLLSRRG